MFIFPTVPFLFLQDTLPKLVQFQDKMPVQRFIIFYLVPAEQAFMAAQHK